jgi:hypothetical protein
MPLWEYKKLDLADVPLKIADTDILNEAGKDGWELVSLTANSLAYLKRQIPEAAKRNDKTARATRRRPDPVQAA